MRAALPACALLLTLHLVAPAASADDAAVATQLFEQGKSLMAGGDFAAACPKLADSVRLDATVGALAKLAECEEHRARPAAARARWQQALDLARARGDRRAARVQAEVTRLDAVVPRLLLSGAGGPGATIAVQPDGVTVTESMLGTAIPVEPGHHEVVVTSSGKRRWSAQVDTRADGATTRVTIPVLVEEPAATTATAPPPGVSAVPPSASEPAVEASHASSGERSPVGLSGLRIAGLAAGGAGVLALGAGAWLAVEAQSKNRQSYTDGCSGNACSPAGYDVRNDARTDGNVATAALAGGAALAAAGVTLWVLGGRGTVHVEPSVGPQAGGVVVTGAW
jgi:hypothetical protein